MQKRSTNERDKGRARFNQCTSSVLLSPFVGQMTACERDREMAPNFEKGLVWDVLNMEIGNVFVTLLLNWFHHDNSADMSNFYLQ